MDRKKVLLQCFITAATCTNKFAGGTVKNENISNHELAEKLQN